MSNFLPMALLAASLPNAVVITSVANMYSRPSEEADVVSQTVYASNVAIMEEEQGWTKVRTPDDYAGWMLLRALRRQPSYASSGQVVQVESLFANLYREPDVSRHQPLLTVPFETRLEVMAEPEVELGWLHVRLPDDRSAWLQRGDVSLVQRPLSIDEAVALSKRFLGLPYYWGGTSSFGYDCSGFTQMLCRRRGAIIPRDTGLQAHWNGAVPVTTKDLRPGDLLFFGKSAENITHTGMYIGDSKFIHATTYQRPVVQISELNDPHWTELLVAARRLK